jgi:L-malate glycosyltransferase
VASETRVIHINTERTWRGGERQVLQLASRLPAHGFPSIIAAPRKSALIDHAEQAEIPCLPLSGTGELSVAVYCNLKKAINRFGASILHIHTSHGMIPAVMVKKICFPDLKIVYSRRTDFHLRNNWLGLSRMKYNKGPDVILTVSNRIREILIEDGLNGDTIHTVHSGVDLTRFIPRFKRQETRTMLNISDNQILVGMVAALVPHKDPMVYIQAAETVLDRRSDVAFLLVGAGKLKPDLEQYLSSSRHKSRIILTGFRTDIPEILSALDLFCMSSVEEGLCTSILDAMAMQLPVVATRAGGIPEAVEESQTGLLVETRNPERFADAILTLIADRDRLEEYGRKGRKRVEMNFNIEDTVSKTVRVYQDLLET